MTVHSGILSVLIALLATSCASPDREAQARATCTCLQPLDSLNTEFTRLLAQADNDLAMARLQDIAAAAQEAFDCLEDLGTIGDPGQDQRLEALLNANCPNWKALLESLPPDQ